MTVARLFPTAPKGGQPAPALAWLASIARVTDRLFAAAADAEARGRSSDKLIDGARIGIVRMALACDGVLTLAFPIFEKHPHLDELLSGRSGGYSAERRLLRRLNLDAATAGELLAGRSAPSPGSVHASAKSLDRVGRAVWRLSRNYPPLDQDGPASGTDTVPTIAPEWRRTLRGAVRVPEVSDQRHYFPEDGAYAE